MRKSLLVAAGLLSGCMLIDNIAPENRLSDQVHELNDEVRWGRIDLAVQRVAGPHRAAFLAQHRSWGNDVRVADFDVMNIEMNLPDGGAASTVVYGWIDERSMELRSTSVRQRWVSSGEGFVLVSEEIAGGEPELLHGAPILGEEGSSEVDGEAVTTAGDEEEGWSEVRVAADDPAADSIAALPEEDGAPAPATAAPSRRRDSQGLLID